MGFQSPAFYSLAVRPWTLLSLRLRLLIPKYRDNHGLKESRKLFVIQCLCININDNEQYSAWQQILLANSDPTSSLHSVISGQSPWSSLRCTTLLTPHSFWFSHLFPTVWGPGATE